MIMGVLNWLLLPLSLVIICIKNNSPMMKKSGRRDDNYIHIKPLFRRLLFCLHKNILSVFYTCKKVGSRNTIFMMFPDAFS